MTQGATRPPDRVAPSTSYAATMVRHHLPVVWGSALRGDSG